MSWFWPRAVAGVLLAGYAGHHASLAVRSAGSATILAQSDADHSHSAGGGAAGSPESRATYVQRLKRDGVVSVYSDVAKETSQNVGCLLRKQLPKCGRGWSEISKHESLRSLLEKAEAFCSGKGKAQSSDLAMMQRAYEVQQGLLQEGIPGSFHSLNAYGMFRNAWNAAAYSLVKGYRPIPGEVVYPFIPRMMPVLPLSEVKQALRDPEIEEFEEQEMDMHSVESGMSNRSSESSQGLAKHVRGALEMANAVSTSPRIDDCTAGESFTYFYVQGTGGLVSSLGAVASPDHIVQPMADDMMAFLSQRASKVASTAGHGEVGDFWKASLMAMWEHLPAALSQTSTVALMVAHGTDAQVGESMYRSAPWGVPQNKGGISSREELLAAEEQEYDPDERYAQMRVRPWSAIEMLQEDSDFGAGGIAGFRLMPKEQVNKWNEVYDKMVKLLTETIIEKNDGIKDLLVEPLRLDVGQKASAKCCCPKERASVEKPCQLVRKVKRCHRPFLHMQCSCLLKQASWESFQKKQKLCLANPAIVELA